MSASDELRGPDELQVDLIRDLRGYSPLAAALEGVVGYGEAYGDDYGGIESTDRVYAGHPKRPKDFPVAAIVTPIWDGSDHLGGGVTRTYRIQITVLATWAWYDEQAWPTIAMQEIMARVGDRMDRAATIPNHRPAGADGGAALETEDGERLAMTADWRLEHTQAFGGSTSE